MDNYSLRTNQDVSKPAEMGSNQLFSTIMNSFSPVGFMGNLLNPEQVRLNEMAQNAALWKMNAEWNSAGEQMQRAADAGINLNTAAGAVAGQGQSGAAPAEPASQQGAAAQTLGALAETAASAAGVGNAVTAAFKAPSEIGLNLATSTAALEKAGFDKTSAAGVEIDNKYKDLHNLADLNIKQQQFENMKEEWSHIERQIQLLDKEIANYDELIKSEIDLNKKSALESEQRQKYLERQTYRENQYATFFDKYHFDANSPTDVALRNAWIAGDYDRYNAMLIGSYDYFYSQASANAQSSWLSRPETPTAMAAQIAHDASGILKSAANKLASGESLNPDDIESLKKDKKMQSAYDDYVDWLESRYLDAKTRLKIASRKPYYLVDNEEIKQCTEQVEYWRNLKESMSFEKWLEKSSYETQF